eukprot:717099_1
MEFSDIGAHCHYDLCQQQTYLPFNCDSCQYKFCKLHRAQKSHECPNLSQEIHEAKEIEKQKIKQNKKTKVNKPIHKCNYKKCKKREWIEFECNKCNLSYCLKHRAWDSHKCDTIIKTEMYIKKLLAKQNDINCSQQIIK